MASRRVPRFGALDAVHVWRLTRASAFEREKERWIARQFPDPEVSLLEVILRIIIFLLIGIFVMPVVGVVFGSMAVGAIGYKAMHHLYHA